MDLSSILRDGHIEDREDREQEGRKEGRTVTGELQQTGSELSMVPKTAVRAGDDGSSRLLT